MFRPAKILMSEVQTKLIFLTSSNMVRKFILGRS